MLAKIAWRNIWRNKLRSGVVIISIAIGLWAGIFASGIIKGVNQQRMVNIINTQSSHIQIHYPGFTNNYEIDKLIDKPDVVNGLLEGNEEVKGYSERLVLNGMVASASNQQPVQIKGVVPEKELSVSPLNNFIVEGEYFEGTKRNPVLIGKALADKLKLKVRKKLVVSFQNADGDFTKLSCRVAGIYNTNDARYDQLTLFMRQSDLARTASLQGKAHEYAIILKNEDNLEAVSEELSKALPDLLVENWKQLMPGFDYANKVSARMNYLLLIILLAAMSFGIINTMLMAVLERVRELGMLMAVGMNRGKIFGMILLETLFLMLTALPIGLLAGWGAVTYFGKFGLDFGEGFDDAFQSVGMSSKIYPFLEWDYYPVVIVLVVIAAFLAALYPARKATKLNPAEAIRKI